MTKMQGKNISFTFPERPPICSLPSGFLLTFLLAALKVEPTTHVDHPRPPISWGFEVKRILLSRIQTDTTEGDRLS